MARIRSLKPTFWTDEKIGVLPRDVRLTFIGLISAMADDHGRLVGSARIVRGAVYPYDDDVTVATIADHLEQLARAGRIVRYTVNGDDYIQIANWTRHQKVDRPSASLLPPPPDSFDESSSNARRTNPTEEEGEKEGTGVTDSPSSAGAPAVEFDAVAELLSRIPETSRPAWAAEISAAEQGMHGPPLARERIIVACRDYVGNGIGERPSLRHFRGYLENAGKARASPRQPRPSKQAAGRADLAAWLSSDSDNGTTHG